jgi:uncharacterized protein
MKEQPITFKCRGTQLVGMLHTPARLAGPAPGVLFLHGFTGSKVEAHRMFVKAARALAKKGFVCLRFDFRGSGDSGGEFQRMTLSGEVADARAALRWLRARKEVDLGRVGLVGMSMGGAVAAHLLGEDLLLRAAVLWAPVGNTRRLVESRLTPEQKGELSRSGLVDLDGWLVGRSCVDDMMHRDPLRAISGCRAAVLLIHGDGDETVPVSDTHEYLEALRDGESRVEASIIRGADHTFAAAPWEAQLIGETVGWLTARMPRRNGVKRVRKDSTRARGIGLAKGQRR